jgi:LysR family glycine cleavage system transcriptional activator
MLRPMADLPPLNAVRVFEAVARLHNLSRAADELNMTQSAVSYQVKQLEAFAGAALFTRLARGVELNSKGLLLAPAVTRSLNELRSAFRQIRDESGSLLVISTMQTVASNWLAPRIGKLQLEHPDLAVKLDISARMVDFTIDPVDVAIRSGKGQWPGLVSHFLIAMNFTAVASPDYLAREGRPATPEAMLDHVLIAPSDDWWNVWFAAAGVNGPIRIARPGIDVETQQMAARVALGGNGIVLATPGFVAEELESGRLIRLFDVEATTGSDYYLVYPEETAHRRKVKLFRDWVLQEAGRT